MKINKICLRKNTDVGEQKDVGDYAGDNDTTENHSGKMMKDKSELKALVVRCCGCLKSIYLDVLFDVCRMSNTEKHIKVRKLFEANEVLSKLKSKKGVVSFPALEKNPSNLNIISYFDPTYASLEND